MIENGNAYFMYAPNKVLRQFGPGVLDENKGKLYIDFSFKDLKGVIDPNSAPELKLRVSSSGTMSIVYPLRQDAIESVWIKSVKDDTGNTVAELLCAQAPRGELLDTYLLSRNLPKGWKWCLSNEENIIELGDQKTLAIANAFIKRILDPQTHEKLENGLSNDMARIAAIFETPSGKEAVWTKTRAMEFKVPKDATRVLKFYVVWAEGFEQTFSGVTFKTITTITDDAVTKGLMIGGYEGTTTLLGDQGDYLFTSPYGGKVSLMLNLPYSDYKPAFELSCDENGNLLAELVLKEISNGEIQASHKVTGCEYQETYSISKSEQLDKVLIFDVEDEGKKVVGLSRRIPSDIEYRTEHAIAVMHAEDIIKKMEGSTRMSYEVWEETSVGRRRIDITAPIGEGETIWEVKTGVTEKFTKQEYEEIDKDSWLIQNGKYSTAYYYFDQTPSVEGAKKYLGYIRYVYENNPTLTNKVFVIIGNGNPVMPTDPSLDPYILNPFPLPEK